MRIIDESKIHKGRNFLISLGLGEYVPLKKQSSPTGYPAFRMTHYSSTAGNSNLVNVTALASADAKPKIIGGIKGPTSNPSKDFLTFEACLETLIEPENYRRALEVIDETIWRYYKENSKIFLWQ